MNKTNISIATVTWARNTKEENLMRQALQALSATGLPLFITDGGSSGGFVSFLKGLPQSQLFSAIGLWPQAKKSITEASKAGASIIFYTEPDKLQLFVHHLPAIINAIAEEDKGGIVLLSRSATAYNSFPPFQQMTENTINACCKEITGKEMDYCYGPFFFNSRLIPLVENLPENCGWGWRPFLFAAAHRSGFTVESLVGEFSCPPEQQPEDATERIYRMKQLTQNIEGLVQAATTGW